MTSFKFQNEEDAARSVKYATDESGQPAYVRYDDSIITPKLVQVCLFE